MNRQAAVQAEAQAAQGKAAAAEAAFTQAQERFLEDITPETQQAVLAALAARDEAVAAAARLWENAEKLAGEVGQTLSKIRRQAWGLVNQMMLGIPANGEVDRKESEGYTGNNEGGVPNGGKPEEANLGATAGTGEGVQRGTERIFSNWFRASFGKGGQTGREAGAGMAIQLRGAAKEDLIRGDYTALIGRDVFESDRFKEMTQGTQAVDMFGKPLVLFHGTRAVFSTFETQAGDGKNFDSSVGFVFTNSPAVADQYAQESHQQGEPGVVPVVLNMQAPVEFTAAMFGDNYQNQNMLLKCIEIFRSEGGDADSIKKMEKKLRKRGFPETIIERVVEAFETYGDIDGMIVRDADWDFDESEANDQYIVFEANQIIPATREYWERMEDKEKSNSPK